MAENKTLDQGYELPEIDLTKYQREPFILPEDEDVTPEIIEKFIEQHQLRLPRYEQLRKEYENEAPILGMKKPDFKPNNKLVVGYPGLLVNTLEGYFSGIAPKVSHEDEQIDDRLKVFKTLNHFGDVFAEVSKKASIYGHAYTVNYQDYRGRTRIAPARPQEGFVVYDDTIGEEPILGVLYQHDDEGNLKGTLYTYKDETPLLSTEDGLQFGNAVPHFFDEVPIVEWIHNEERLSLIETVLTLIHALNKTVSEKANDVDYFADAYLKILGVKLNKEDLKDVRDLRIMNFKGDGSGEKPEVGFIDKPSGDNSQENLLDRLERLIHKVSMIPDVSSEEFAQAASGRSLEFKLLSMSNLANTKERKFRKSLQRVFEMWFNVPTQVPGGMQDEWINLEYTFIRNSPQNVLEEIKAAQEAVGLLSHESRLSMISRVDDPKQELEKLESERHDEFQANDPYQSLGQLNGGE